MAKREGYRGYITSRPFLGERAPQHVQNLVIRDYAQRRGLEYRLSATEYAMPGCFMMLEQVLGELDVLEGVVCYSLFQLPADAASRNRVYGRVIEASASLHAAVEGFVLASVDGIGAVEDVWRVRQALTHCPNAAEIAEML